MGDGWRFSSTLAPSPTTPLWSSGYPTATAFEVDDRAPIPLIVGIALALFIGFIIIVCCICRRRSLSSSASTQNANPLYQRAPTADGANMGVGYGGGGVGGGSYPMTAVNHSAYVPPSGQPIGGMHGHPGAGGMPMGQNQHQPTTQQPYPSLPPNAYTPPYPIGYAPLPSYMPTSQSSHASSASGPSSDHGPSGFSSSSPPAPAPAPTGMMAGSGDQGNKGAFGTLTRPQGAGAEYSVGQGQGMGQAGSQGPAMGQMGAQSSAMGQIGVMGHGMGQAGLQGQGMGHQGLSMGQGFQTQGSTMGQFVGMGNPVSQGTMFGTQEPGMRQEGEGGGDHTPLMHPTAMDYVPAGSYMPRIASPLPPALDGTTSTELGQL